MYRHKIGARAPAPRNFLFLSKFYSQNKPWNKGSAGHIGEMSPLKNFTAKNGRILHLQAIASKNVVACKILWFETCGTEGQLELFFSSLRAPIENQAQEPVQNLPRGIGLRANNWVCSICLNQSDPQQAKTIPVGD